MCKRCYCNKCKSECYVCANCGEPVSIDLNWEIDGFDDMKFCSEKCLNEFEINYEKNKKTPNENQSNTGEH